MQVLLPGTFWETILHPLLVESVPQSLRTVLLKSQVNSKSLVKATSSCEDPVLWARPLHWVTELLGEQLGLP